MKLLFKKIVRKLDYFSDRHLKNSNDESLENYESIVINPNHIKETISKKTLVYISSAVNSKFNMEDELKNMIFEEKVSTLFRYGVYLSTSVDNDARWNREWVYSLNHIGRSDDDAIYGYAQDLAMDMVNSIQIDDTQLNLDFNTLKETIAYQTSENYAVLLRSAVMLMEECKKYNYDKVIICGADLHFSLAIYNILKLNGFNSMILQPSSLTDIKAKAIVDIYLKKSIENRMIIPRKNNDVEGYVDSLKIIIKPEDNFVFSLVRTNDRIYFETIARIAKALSNYKFFILDSFYSDKIKDKLETSGLSDNFINLTKKVGFLENEESLKFKNNLISGMRKMMRRNITYKQYKLDGAFLLFGAQYFGIQVVSSIFYYRVFYSLFKERRPHAVTLSPVRSVEARAAAEAAKKFKITSFDTQSGTLAYSRRLWKSNASYTFCSDALSKQIYIDFFKIEKSKILLVGSPRLDHNVEKYKNKRILNPKYKKIFLALQTFSSEINTKMINTCLEAIKDMKNVELTIGFHPGDTENNKNEIIKNIDTKLNISTNDSLSDLACHDICITYFSFLGIEAFSIGCKVIALNVFEHREWPFRLSDLKIAQEAYNVDELKKLIMDDKVLDINDSNRVLRDGLSLERISNAIGNNLNDL